MKLSQPGQGLAIAAAPETYRRPTFVKYHSRKFQSRSKVAAVASLTQDEKAFPSDGLGWVGALSGKHRQSWILSSTQAPVFHLAFMKLSQPGQGLAIAAAPETYRRPTFVKYHSRKFQSRSKVAAVASLTQDEKAFPTHFTRLLQGICHLEKSIGQTLVGISACKNCFAFSSTSGKDWATVSTLCLASPGM